VTLLAADSALAVAPMVVNAERFSQDGGGKLVSSDIPAR